MLRFKCSEMENRNSFEELDPEKDQSYFHLLSHENNCIKLFFRSVIYIKQKHEISLEKHDSPMPSEKTHKVSVLWGRSIFRAFQISYTSSERVIMDTSGKVIGEHDGAFQYTIGQEDRCRWGPGTFVVEKDVEKILSLSERKTKVDFFRQHVQSWRWIGS